MTFNEGNLTFAVPLLKSNFGRCGSPDTAKLVWMQTSAGGGLSALSCEDKNLGAVAQLVEQRTENPCVGGSIPPHTTNTNKKPYKSIIYEAFFIWGTQWGTLYLVQIITNQHY